MSSCIYNEPESKWWLHLKAPAKLCMFCRDEGESECKEGHWVWKQPLAHLCTQCNGCSGLCIILLITYSSCINQWVRAFLKLLVACMCGCARVLSEWIMTVYTSRDIFLSTPECRSHYRVKRKGSSLQIEHDNRVQVQEKRRTFLTRGKEFVQRLVFPQERKGQS